MCTERGGCVHACESVVRWEHVCMCVSMCNGVPLDGVGVRKQNDGFTESQGLPEFQHSVKIQSYHS